MNKVFRLFFLIISINLFSQKPNLDGWKKGNLPLGDSIYKANNSKNHWIFEKIDNDWKIAQRKFNRNNGDKLEVSKEIIEKNKNILDTYNGKIKKVNDECIIGLNNGEVGGGLFILSKNGEKITELNCCKRVQEIFEYNGKIFAITGLSHLGLSYGSLIEIYKDKSKWTFKEISRLIEAPDFTVENNNSRLIITDQHILNFNNKNEISIILKSPFYWGMLYPSNALIDGDDLYLSMRQGVLKIVSFEKDPKYEWYIPEK